MASATDPGEAEPSLERDPPQGDDLLAVIAHSLLTSVSVLVGGTELLSRHWADVAADERASLLDRMHAQARHIGEVLDNLVRLGDPLLIEALDGLNSPDDDAGPTTDRAT